MSPDELEEAKWVARKREAQRSRRIELRLTFDRMRRMTFLSRTRHMLAPLGRKFEFVRAFVYLFCFATILYVAYAYSPPTREDPLDVLHAKLSYPCGTDIGLSRLDTVMYNRLDSSLVILATEARPIKPAAWEINPKIKNDYVYSADKIAALVSFLNEISWLSSADKFKVMRSLNDLGRDVRADPNNNKFIKRK